MASDEVSDDVFGDLPAPHCAHSRVRRVPLNHDDGTVSDRWLCDDCLCEFALLSWVAAAEVRLKEEKRDRQKDCDHLLERLLEVGKERDEAQAKLADVLDRVREVLNEHEALGCAVRSGVEVARHIRAAVYKGLEGEEPGT